LRARFADAGLGKADIVVRDGGFLDQGVE